jgi:hypothetical protein
VLRHGAGATIDERKVGGDKGEFDADFMSVGHANAQSHQLIETKGPKGQIFSYQSHQPAEIKGT